MAKCYVTRNSMSYVIYPVYITTTSRQSLSWPTVLSNLYRSLSLSS